MNNFFFSEVNGSVSTSDIENFLCLNSRFFVYFKSTASFINTLIFFISIAMVLWSITVPPFNLFQEGNVTVEKIQIDAVKIELNLFLHLKCF